MGFGLDFMDSSKNLKAEETHPSHEGFTGKPYHAIGDRVFWLSYSGIVVGVQGFGDDKQSVFEYKVRLDGGTTTTNWVRSSDIRKEK